MGPKQRAGRPHSLLPRGAGVLHLPGNQAGLGVDVQGREPLHDLKDVHRLRHPWVEEADVSVDTVERVTVTPSQGVLDPRTSRVEAARPLERPVRAPGGTRPPPADPGHQDCHQEPAEALLERQRLQQRRLRESVNYLFHFLSLRLDFVEWGRGDRRGGEAWEAAGALGPLPPALSLCSLFMP